MGTFYPGIPPSSPGGGTLTVLQQNPASFADTHAVYLLSQAVPGGTLMPTPTGGVLITVFGEITCQAGGAALAASDAGLVIRNSVGGVPSTAFPVGIFTPFTQTGAAGLLDNAACNVQLFGTSYCYNDDSDDYGNPLTMFAQSNVAAPNQIRGMSTFPLLDQSVAPDFTTETLWQIVLVQNGGTLPIPPANFAAWTPIATQLAIFT
jgi:hypothetical protein